MKTAIITGSAGLVGAETVRLFSAKGFATVGIDNDMRRTFFGPESSTAWSRELLSQEIPTYQHEHLDIRDAKDIEQLFCKFNSDIGIVIHAAGQPSHDWAAREPFVDFDINARGTLVLLECCRRYCPDAVFVYMSTNKVYGDTPNRLPLVELEPRWEVDPQHPFAENGIDETMTIDQSKHSLFGASKLAGDLLVQEYGRYFGVKTACFRAGCLTGPGHSGTELHGFLSYLVQSVMLGRPYQVFGYKGKQVRDNLHAADLASMFWHFYQTPRPGAVYNVGGGRKSNCSVREAISLCEELTGKRVQSNYNETNRNGDHIWWISDTSKFRLHYPQWCPRYDLRMILVEMIEQFAHRRQLALTPAAGG